MTSDEQDHDDAGASQAEDQRSGGTDTPIPADDPTTGDLQAPSPPPVTPEPADVEPSTEEPLAGPAANGVDEPVAEPYQESPPGAEEPFPVSAAAEAPDTEATATAGNAVPPAGVDEVAAESWTAETYADAPVVDDWGAEPHGDAPSFGEGEHVVSDTEAADAYPQYEEPAEAPADADDQLAPAAYEPPVPTPPRSAPGRGRGPASRRSARADRPPRPRTAPPPPTAPAPPPGGANRWMVVLLSVLTVAVVALAIYAVSLSRRDNNGAAAPPTTVAPRPVVTLPPGAFTTFRDDETGFTIRYPSAWQRFDAPVREIRLSVGDGPYSVRIRSRRTEEATTTQNLANLKAFADGSIAGPTVVVLQQDPVSLNGLIGFRYLYTFTDEDSGIQGAHLHYFLFQGHKMHDLIFQALPTESFNQIEGVFNQMLESFRSDPEPTSSAPATGPPPTTTG